MEHSTTTAVAAAAEALRNPPQHQQQHRIMNNSAGRLKVSLSKTQTKKNSLRKTFEKN